MSRPRVTGIGGIFFKARDPKALAAWYASALGVDVQTWGGAAFHWQGHERSDTPGYTVWSPFEEDTTYFAPSEKGFMVNFRVDDLEAMLASLRQAGARVLDRRADGEQGKFGYVLDPEGALIELWEPSADDPSLPRNP